LFQQAGAGPAARLSLRAFFYRINVKTRFFAAALLLLATGVSAQAIYSKVDLGGHATYSDLPFTAAEPETEIAPAAVAPRAPAGVMRIGSRRGAIVNANEAKRRLAQAQLKRRHGLEPLPGERAQDSGTNVNYRYWRRQERLRLDVETAQRRANATDPAQIAGR
jgi:hypothetical protein